MVDTMRVLYRLADQHAGYFTAAEALSEGISRRTLSGRNSRGDIEHIQRGIYRLRDYPAHPFEDVVVATLWAGPKSAASHETALAIHGISDAMPATIHLTVTRPFRGRAPGVSLHFSALPDKDRELHESVPVTTVSRTLRDVATSTDPTLVRQAIHDAITRGALSRRQLRHMARESAAIAPLVVDVLTEDL